MANYQIKMLKDENGTPFVPLVSTQGVQDPEGKTLDEKLSTKLGPDNLIGGENINIRTEGNNCYIDMDLPANLNIINNLTTDSAGQGALDAYQGKVLNGLISQTKEAIPAVIDDLTNTSSTSSLSANQGYVLNGKINSCVKISDLEDLVNSIILKKHPIGSIEINVSGTNPSEYIGGTWESYGSGRVLVGVDTSQTEFNTVMKTGGEKTVTLNTNQIPSHSHGARLNNSGEHQHSMWFGGGANSGDGGQIPVANSRWGRDTADMSTGDHDHGGITVDNTGGNQAHNNLQPYITVYIWRRTA